VGGEFGFLGAFWSLWHPKLTKEWRGRLREVSTE
jgi:hypothetical protein